MFSMSRTAAFVVLSLLAVGPAAVWAQGNQKPPTERIRASGKIQGVAGGFLLVTTSDGDQYRVKVPDNRDNIVYNASATPDWVQRGMWVSFSARFNKKGQVTEPITQLTVFTPQKDTRFGILADNLAGGSDLFADTKPETKPGEETMPYSVVGRVTAFRNGALTVFAGNSAVKVDVAEAAKVSVNVAQLNFVRAGDSVSIEGWYLPQQKRDVVATRLTVSAAEPLGSEKKPDEPKNAESKTD